MRVFALLLSIQLIAATAYAQADSLKIDCNKFNDLNTAILNNTLSAKKARLQFKLLINNIKAHSPVLIKSTWCFPLQGYSYTAVGGVRGNGYFDKGYNYFDGNKHTGHPAHDIFIHDKNQDCLDYRTKLPVAVLCVEDGVVIANCTTWDADSKLRGGKYIWIYHPQSNTLTYYAHNQQIFVKVGDVVKQSQKIADVGRTGFSAYKKRSPTHLHFSAFRLINNLPLAYNCYYQLVKAKNL
jgi:murein DD-endopeptidase MepM/ murein hydrolase activator NlpD